MSEPKTFQDFLELANQRGYSADLAMKILERRAIIRAAAARVGFTCISCGARTDSDGKLPCGH